MKEQYNTLLNSRVGEQIRPTSAPRLDDRVPIIPSLSAELETCLEYSLQVISRIEALAQQIDQIAPLEQDPPVDRLQEGPPSPALINRASVLSWNLSQAVNRLQSLIGHLDRAVL